MNPPQKGGTRLAIVFNALPLFTGSAGSGESDISRWIIENDWLEIIVALPTELFYNTGINTYIWIVATANHKYWLYDYHLITMPRKITSISLLIVLLGASLFGIFFVLPQIAGVGLMLQIQNPTEAYWYPYNVTYNSYPLQLQFRFNTQVSPLPGVTWGLQYDGNPLMRLEYELYNDENHDPFFKDSIDLYGKFGPGFLTVKPGIEMPSGVKEIIVNATLWYYYVTWGGNYLLSSAKRRAEIDMNDFPDSGRYHKYYSGYLRRHLLSVGRGLSWVWLKEYEPGIDPKELLYYSRTFLVSESPSASYHPIKVYVPWMSDDGAIYGGDENPLLRSGLAMASFALEFLTTGGRSDYSSLIHALEIFEYLEASEWIDGSGSPTGFFLRSTWPGDVDHQVPFYASIDEIVGMTLGLYYLHLALEDVGTTGGPGYVNAHNKLKALVWRLGNQLRSNYFFIVPPEGLPQERQTGWAGGYAFQWFLNGAFRQITGQSFKPAGEVLKKDSDAWRRMKNLPWRGSGPDDKDNVEKLVDLELEASHRAIVSIQGIGFQMYYGGKRVIISFPFYGDVAVDIPEFDHWNFPMLLHCFQLGMADAENRDPDIVEDIRIEMRRLIRGVLFDAVSKTTIDVDKILDAWLGIWTPTIISMDVAVGASGEVPDYYAAAIAMAYDLFTKEDTKSKLSATFLRIRDLLADDLPVGQRDGIADLNIHDVWSSDNVDGKIILNHNPTGKLGSAFIWEHAPGANYEGWIADGGGDGNLGLTNQQIKEACDRGVDVMREGAGLDFIFPTALLRYKKRMFLWDTIYRDPDGWDTRLLACTLSPQPGAEPYHYEWPNLPADQYEINDKFEMANAIRLSETISSLSVSKSGERSLDRVAAVYYSSWDSRWYTIWWWADDVDYYKIKTDEPSQLIVRVHVKEPTPAIQLAHRLVVDHTEVTTGTQDLTDGSKWMIVEVPAKGEHLIMFTGDVAEYEITVS